MRLLVPALALAFPLAACGESNEAEGERDTSAMTANAISSNDITAIDAVTGEAANMAADVQIDANLLEDENAAGNEAAGSDRPRRPARPTGSSRNSAPANDSADAAANSAE
jgi:hypothetical protein